MIRARNDNLARSDSLIPKVARGIPYYSVNSPMGHNPDNSNPMYAGMKVQMMRTITPRCLGTSQSRRQFGSDDVWIPYIHRYNQMIQH